MKFLKKRIWIAFSILLIAILGYLLFPKAALHPDNITADFPYNPLWEVPKTENGAKIDQILNQPFTYIGEGGQSYVFSSADKNYVLKLFKFNRFRPTVFVALLPDIFPFKTYKNSHRAKRNQKLITALYGHKLAYDLHRSDSGLIFIQLNPSHVSRQITVFDKSSRQWSIDLAEVSFVLQERGEMLSVALSKILDQGDLQVAKERIDQLLQLYLSEYRKGIYDLDHGVMHNIGVHDEKIFHLDVGKLTADERIRQPEFYREDLRMVVSKLERWLKAYYPQYFQELNHYLERKFMDVSEGI